MSEEETNTALVSVMIRALDSWFIAYPALTHDAVTAWLESIEAHDYEEVETAATDTDDWPSTITPL